MNIKWVGPVFDPSGYGVANRDYLRALSHHGHNITVDVNPFVVQKHKDHPFLESLLDRSIDYNTVIHHYVPNRLRDRIEEGKFNIGYNTWETDKIPNHWVSQLNMLDLLLVPSTFNKDVYKNCGVTVPIEVVPHCIDLERFDKAPDYIEKYDNPAIRGRFTFFSVHQWTERKNSINLLKAYLSAFYNNDCDKVALVLKTYRGDTSQKEKVKIIQQVNELKEDMCFTVHQKCPPIVMLSDIVPDEEMMTMYKMFDCFVLPTRAEGFGLPILEAMISKMPIITTNYSGHLDFCCTNFQGLTHSSSPKDVQLCHLIPFQFTPVAHMKWIPFYDGTQVWAEPDVVRLKEAMRYVFHGLYPYDIDNAAKIARNKHSYENIAKLFTDVIEKHMRS